MRGLAESCGAEKGVTVFRVISLVLIMAILSAGVFALSGEFLAGLFIRGESAARDYAFTVDQLGNIFFVRKDGGGQSLIVLDSTGREWLRTPLGPYFAEASAPEEDFFVDMIYILQNKNIWVTGYSYNPGTLVISGVKIVALREDGNYIGNVFSREGTVFKDGLYRMASSPGEDDRLAYFALLGEPDEPEGTIDIYAYTKDAPDSGDSQRLRRIRQYRPVFETGVDIVAMHALPGGGLVVSASDGSMRMYGSGSESNEEILDERNGWTGRRVDRFWNGPGVFYMRDAVSGTVFSSLTWNLRPVESVNGDFVISEQRDILFKDMHDISVSGVGNVLGVLRTESGSELHLGGFTFLPHISSVSAVKQAQMTDWFIFVSLAVGIIIVSVLIWEFYVHFMRMRMSMIIRQTLLAALTIFVSFFVVMEYFLIPSVTETLERSYRESLSSNSGILLSSLKTAVEPGSSSGEYNDFMGNFGDRYNPDGSPVFAYLIADGGRSGNSDLILAASSGKHPPGIIINGFLPYHEIINAVREGVPPEGRYAAISTETGEMVAFIQPSGISYISDVLNIDYQNPERTDILFCVIENLSELENSIGGFAAMVNGSLLITGVLLSVLIILITVFHVFTLRRLNRTLHNFGLGIYGPVPDIHSGDETGEMYGHVKKLSEVLRNNEESIRTLSTYYNRFVPARFMKLLGETRVEKVGKGLQTRIEGAYAVFIRFDVEGSDGDGGNVFQNTNRILESIVPLVGHYGGTVYNFLYNGFDAVFENSANHALSAALSIRDSCRRFNAANINRSGSQADLRAVLAKGDFTLGFIGDENRMESAAISDAHRLIEPLVRTCFGSDIFVAVTSELYAGIKNEDYCVRRIGNINAGVSGETIGIYDIYDSDPASLMEFKKGFSDKFEAGVSLFARGNYSGARKMFMEIIKHSAEDGATRNYLYLSEYNIRNTDKQLYYTAFENESMKKHFGSLSDSYYSNAGIKTN